MAGVSTHVGLVVRPFLPLVALQVGSEVRIPAVAELLCEANHG
ncbi:hypothetical protein ACFPRL_26875 [Pseudoclavibacter helvolus]